MPKHLYYYTETDDYIEVPIGATSDIIDILNENVEIKDLRNTRDLETPFETKFTLRDYQKKVLKELEDKTIGVIESPTGSGKSFIVLDLIKQKNQNTIILVDTCELWHQFRTRLKEQTALTEKDIGYVGDGKKVWKPVTVALLQTMRNLNDGELEYVNSHFGLLISDEVHVVRTLENFIIILYTIIYGIHHIIVKRYER